MWIGQRSWLATKSPKAVTAKKIPAEEKLSCRTGPNDEQVRLIVQAVKGRVREFAFYRRLGPRVCSIHAQRGDAYTKKSECKLERIFQASGNGDSGDPSSYESMVALSTEPTTPVD